MKEKEKEQIKLPKTIVKGNKKKVDKNGKEVNTEPMWRAILTLIGVLLILFVLFGGVNQRKVIEGIYKLSHNISETIGRHMDLNKIDVTDDGIYINPNK